MANFRQSETHAVKRLTFFRFSFDTDYNFSLAARGSALKKVKHMHLRKGLSVDELVEQLQQCGVLGAGKIGKAAELTAKMFGDPDYTVFLTLAGALVPGGFRNIIARAFSVDSCCRSR